MLLFSFQCFFFSVPPPTPQSAITYIQIFSILKQITTKIALASRLTQSCCFKLNFLKHICLHRMSDCTTHLPFRLLSFGLCPQHTFNCIRDICICTLQRHFEISMSKTKLPSSLSNNSFQPWQKLRPCMLFLPEPSPSTHTI